MEKSIYKNSEIFRIRTAFPKNKIPSNHSFLNKIKEDPEYFINYLFTMHGIIRASVPLMETALVQCRKLAKKDAVARKLIPYFKVHIQEELNHDEWLLNDLEVMGFSKKTTLAKIPSPDVAAFVGMQYYWIYHDHPISLLGYIGILEGSPPRPEEIDSIQEATGFPKKAFRTLYSHAELDPHHNYDLDRCLDQLPLQPRDISLLCLSGLSTKYFLRKCLQFPSQKNSSAAPIPETPDRISLPRQIS